MTHEAPKGSILQQPRAVWAVAFAAVIAFMGIGLVDPILPAIGASKRDQAQVELLHQLHGRHRARDAGHRVRLQPHRCQAHPAARARLRRRVQRARGRPDTIGQIVGFRAGWGFGNALFIATALATIVGAASGGVASAIILYEAALGIGIATGPLLGGVLGHLSWRAPFFGTAVLMAVGFIAIVVLLPGPRRPRDVPASPTPSERCAIAGC